jgi:hypothetical protein
MATQAICTACGIERRYAARRGCRISRMACAGCGAVGTLTRAGSYPSALARAARKARDWRPHAAPGTHGFVPALVRISRRRRSR